LRHWLFYAGPGVHGLPRLDHPCLGRADSPVCPDYPCPRLPRHGHQSARHRRLPALIISRHGMAAFLHTYICYFVTMKHYIMIINLFFCPRRVAYSNPLVRLSVYPSVSLSVRPFFVWSITLKLRKASTGNFIGR